MKNFVNLNLAAVIERLYQLKADQDGEEVIIKAVVTPKKARRMEARNERAKQRSV